MLPKERTKMSKKTNKDFIINSSECTIIESALAPEENQTTPKKQVKISGLAYSGGVMSVSYWGKIALRLENLKIPESIPLLINHDNDVDAKIGEIRAYVQDDKLYFEGILTAENETTKNIIAQAKNGGKWQLSIGANPTRYSYVDGEIVVNNQNLSGEFTLIEEANLNEISIVAVGADNQTTVKIEASLNLGDKQMAAEPTKVPNVNASTIDENAIKASAIEAERNRIKEIKATCNGEFATIEAEAIQNGNTVAEVQAKVLAALRTKTPPNINLNNNNQNMNKHKIVEAALCQSAGISEAELIKSYGEAVLESANKEFKHSLGLQQLILNAAIENGYSGHQVKGYVAEVMASANSNVSLPGILSNVANKVALAAFNAVDPSWRRIAKIGSVT